MERYLKDELELSRERDGGKLQHEQRFRGGVVPKVFRELQSPDVARIRCMWGAKSGDKTRKLGWSQKKMDLQDHTYSHSTLFLGSSGPVDDFIQSIDLMGSESQRGGGGEMG